MQPSQVDTSQARLSQAPTPPATEVNNLPQEKSVYFDASLAII